jgi:hypothetical protein
MRTQQISPSVNGAAVTPNDTTNLANYSLKGWSVNSDGYVKVLLRDQAEDSTPLVVWAVKGVRYPDIIKRFLIPASNAATGVNVYW